MRLLTVGGLLAYRALFNWETPAMFVGTLLAGPLFQLLFFAFLGRQLGVADDSFFVVGNAVDAASAACLFGGTMAVVNERRYGTLAHVLLSPRPRAAIFLGRATPYAVNGLLVSVVTLVVGATLLRVRVPAVAWPGLVLVVATAALSSAMLGLGLGALALRARDVWLLSNAAAAALVLATGAAVPRSVLPRWLQVLGDLLPMTHAIAAARSLVSGATLAAVAPEVAAEASVAVAFAGVAALLLLALEGESRRKGTLETL